MSVNNIPFLDPSQVPTPPAGHYSLFYDTSNGNVLSYKDNDCNICVIGELPGITPDTTKIDDCLCDIVEGLANDFGCSVSKGIMTIADFNSWFQNIQLFSAVTIDPSTGSVTHGMTSTPVLFVQLTTTNVICNGDATGTAAVTVSGGDAPFTIVWEDLTPAVVDPAILTAGAYTVTVSDNAGTVRKIAFVITEPPALGLTVGVSGSSPSASASANVVGGTSPYTYEWRDNGGVPIGQTTRVAIGLSTGIFQVFVTDANGCLIDDTNVIIP